MQKEFAQKLLHRAISEEFKISAEQEEILKAEHGKPYFKNLPVHYNISHCAGAVCCAVGEKEVGVDVERADRNALRVSSRICNKAELADIENSENPAHRALQYWTLKESYVKYLGQGLSFGLKNISFVWEKENPILDNDSLPVQHKEVIYEDKSYLLSACGEEIPMPIKIITKL